MKTKPLFATLILTVGVLFSAHSQDWLTNGLVAYYPFSGNANDASGNGNDGTVTAASLTGDRLGIPNRAYLFDGVSSLITVPDSPSLRIANDVTVACWLNLSQTNLDVRFVGKGGDCGRNYGLWGIWGSGSFWMFQQFPPEGGCVGCQENTASTVPTVHIGKWYQLVGVRTGSISRLYLDGILIQERTPTCSTSTYTGDEPLLIGGPGYVGAPGNQPDLMKGSLDDIRIYNRALSSNEVAQLYAIESGPRVDLIKAVKPSFSNLTLGTNYQLQLSGDLSTWTNQGSVFTATNASMVYPQYWDVDNRHQLFFRLQVAP